MVLYTAMDEIERRYVLYRDTPADINEHMPTLLDYAERCPRVTEFGVGRSTWAFLHARPKRMRSYDVRSADDQTHNTDVTMRYAMQVARDAGVDFVFESVSSLEVTIDETDLLFIDTLHTFEQLRAELARHAPATRRYVVMHDTTAFADQGENWAPPGLWQAVEEYLREHPEWRLLARLTNNNGLTILKRERSA